MAVVVTWNPEAWDFPDGQYEAMVAKTQAGGTYPDDWSVGRRVKGIDVGDRVFLFRQGHDRRGLVAAGTVSPGPEAGSPIYPREHWDGSGALTPFVNVEWDRVVEVDDRLPVETLLEAHAGFHWNSVYQSGRAIDGGALTALEELWQAWTGPVSSVDTVVAVTPERHQLEQYWSRGSDEGPRELAEAQLCQRYLAHLETEGSTGHRHRITTGEGTVLWTDLFDPARGELLEAKNATSRPAIRLAIGQLYDYRRYLDPEPALAVLLPDRPGADMLALLTELSITAVWPDDTGGFTRR
ncbi:hypothetical protein [Actinomycetospora sp. CA-084318]|uniref:hypothetical protein n=1 Tax=Actinomycetospora sp. CA-084318 TaxID=3239892 RepID=UPI003D9765E5